MEQEKKKSKKKIIISIIAGVVAGILLVCLSLSVWDRVQYQEKMKSFTPQQTITEYYKWFDQCNMRRTRQLETKEGRVTRGYVNDYEFINVLHIKEIEPEYEWLADENWYEIKTFRVDCSFKKKEYPYDDEGAWEFYLVKESVDSPWQVRDFFAKP